MTVPRLLLLSLGLAACSSEWTLLRSTEADGGLGGGGSAGDANLPSAQLLCEEIPALSSEPTIDGALEPELSLYSWLTEDTKSTRAGVSANVSIAYRPDGVYFFVSVVDPTRDPAPLDAASYCGDGVELYADDDGSIAAPPAYDRPGTMQLVVAAPVDDTSSATRGERFLYPGSGDAVELGTWASSRFVSVPTPSGYTVEALIAAEDLDLATWALAPAGEIGWNLSLNIGGPEPAGIDACTSRSQQVHFRLASTGTCTAPYCNASAFCSATLGAR
jgi:hypothetical protein